MVLSSNIIENHMQLLLKRGPLSQITAEVFGDTNVVFVTDTNQLAVFEKGRIVFVDGEMIDDFRLLEGEVLFGVNGCIVGTCYKPLAFPVSLYTNYTRFYAIIR